MGDRIATAARPLLRKSVDTSRLCVTAALSYPGEDLAGDFVNPAGIDWTHHKSQPWVGLEHWRWTADRTGWVHPGPGDEHLAPVRVGTARTADGRYGVELKAMPEGPIPFGTTQFTDRDRLSYQTFQLVNDGTLEGVSIEFRLIPGQFERLGRSPLEDRPAYRVNKCIGEGWVHCKQPVNPGALILKSLAPHLEQAVRVAQTGKVGSEAAHPLILKSFARFLTGKSTAVVGGFAPESDTIRKAREPFHGAYPQDHCPECGDKAKAGCRCIRNDRWCGNKHVWERLTNGMPALLDRGHGKVIKAYGGMTTDEAEGLRKVYGNRPVPRLEKAMDETMMDPAYAPPEPDGDEAPAADAGGSTPTVQALYQLAQSLQDLKSQVEEMLSGSEHVKGKKFATKLLADLDGTVEDATEMAAKIEAELGQTSEPEGDEEPEEPEPDMEEDDTEPDEDGVLKAIKRRPAVFKAIRRFTLQEFRKAQPVEQIDPELAALVEMQRTQPKKYARIVREAAAVAPLLDR
jgi:hypothetical protein